jgi:hypothetical protein
VLLVAAVMAKLTASSSTLGDELCSPRVAIATDSAVDVSQVAELRRILARHRTLSAFSFGVYQGLGLSARRRAEELRVWRDALLAPAGVAMFVAARNWLAQWEKRTRVNRRGTSYGLKHAAEVEIGYLDNGALIAAAIAEGIQVRPEGNIGKEAWAALYQTRSSPPVQRASAA